MIKRLLIILCQARQDLQELIVTFGSTLLFRGYHHICLEFLSFYILHMFKNKTKTLRGVLFRKKLCLG